MKKKQKNLSYIRNVRYNNKNPCLTGEKLNLILIIIESADGSTKSENQEDVEKPLSQGRDNSRSQTQQSPLFSTRTNRLDPVEYEVIVPNPRYILQEFRPNL